MTENKKRIIKKTSKVVAIISSVVLGFALFFLVFKNIFNLIGNIFLFVLSIFSSNVKFNSVGGTGFIMILLFSYLLSYLFVKKKLKYDFLTKFETFGLSSIFTLPSILIIFLLWFLTLGSLQRSMLKQLFQSDLMISDMMNFERIENDSNNKIYDEVNNNDEAYYINSLLPEKIIPLTLDEKIDSQLVYIKDSIKVTYQPFQYNNDSIYIKSILEYMVLDKAKYKPYFRPRNPDDIDLKYLQEKTKKFLLNSNGKMNLNSKFDSFFNNTLIGEIGHYKVKISIDKREGVRFTGKMDFIINDYANRSEPNTLDLLQDSRSKHLIEGVILNNGFIHFNIAREVQNNDILSDNTFKGFSGFINNNSINGQMRFIKNDKKITVKLYSVPFVNTGLIQKNTNQIITLTIKDNRLKESDEITLAIPTNQSTEIVDFEIINFKFINEDSDIYKQKVLELKQKNKTLFNQTVQKMDSMFTTEVLAFYPKQEDVVYIDKTTISNQYLPQGVKTTDIIYAIDLTSDSEPDLIKISFCIKIDNDSGNCDYTGSKTYYKHNNEEWIVIANTQPM